MNDSASGRQFDLIEEAIYREALDEAKSPTISDSSGVLREVRDTTTTPGRVITRFYGDARLAWEPFTPHALRITRFNTKPAQS